MQIPNFIVWYKNSQGKFATYNYQTKEFKITTKLTYTINNFEMFKGYDASNQGLQLFAEDLIKWRNEILDSTVLSKKFDYFDNSYILSNGNIYYRNHSSNINILLKKLLKVKIDISKDITLAEEDFFDKCNNGGLTYHKDGIYEEITTYDKQMFYPSILGSKYFEFPIETGEIQNFNKIPKSGNFIYGIYNIKVESDDERFNKVFAYSKDHHYTHFSLNFVKYYNKKYNGNVKLTLIGNKCLKYRYEKSLIKSSDMFKLWYYKMKDFKEALPNNKLVKKLSSTVWGELQRKNVLEVNSVGMKDPKYESFGTSLDVNENKYYLKDYKTDGDNEIFQLVDLSKPIYKYQLRLKSFLTSFARQTMAVIALKNIDNVIRIQTDSITYDKKIDIDEYIFYKEEKKSNCKAVIKGNSLIISSS